MLQAWRYRTESASFANKLPVAPVDQSAWPTAQNEFIEDFTNLRPEFPSFCCPAGLFLVPHEMPQSIRLTPQIAADGLT